MHIQNWSTSRKIIVLPISAFIILALMWAAIGFIARIYEFRDDHIDRGARVIKTDLFGEQITETLYPDQGWDEADSLWFYNTTQGSNLLPYDFFLALETSNTEELFRSDENIIRYRYLPQVKSAKNPDALPVGMTRDSYKGKNYLGFTCAACHTTQINYRNTGIRIDGAGTLADMETFMIDLAASMYATLENNSKLGRFAENVKSLGTYDDNKTIAADLQKYAGRIKSYTIVNAPDFAYFNSDTQHYTHYGYGRLDAFGRIYNRVLQHLINAGQLRKVLQDTLTSQEYDSLIDEIDAILLSEDQTNLVTRIENILASDQVTNIRQHLFNAANAPVSYPFLWDVPQHDYVQWNGIVQNSGIGPMGRNAGQVIGVFGTLDWAEKPGYSLSSVLGGQGFGSTHVSFKSSIDIRNLRRVESHLRQLYSPRWEDEKLKDVLPALDRENKARGEVLYKRYCESCHEIIHRDSTERRIVAHMVKLESIQTDPVMALNSTRLTGYSGMLENFYVETGPGNILLQRRAPVAGLLAKATRNVITQPDPDKLFVQRWSERLFDILLTVFDNEVRTSLKHGDYDPDTTAKPFASLHAYKGRPLNGIWATAPYLHNGSVPTLYHLLLPYKEGMHNDADYRPNRFIVGSRQFDPDHVGLSWQGYDGFVFDTTMPGNSNRGHEYAAGLTALPDGSTLPALDHGQRMDLVEFLKSL